MIVKERPGWQLIADKNENSTHIYIKYSLLAYQPNFLFSTRNLHCIFCFVFPKYDRW